MTESAKLEKHPQYDFIAWDPKNPKIVNVSHPLLEGQIVIAEPTRGKLRQYERYVSFEQGLSPTVELMEAAREAGYLALGFETIKGKKPEDSGIDFDKMAGKQAQDLCRGLAEVVQTYWSFR